MKRKYLDIETNNDPSSNENRFYIEHSTVDKNTYCLHFSFKTFETAKIMFERMQHEWKLPVKLVENRIIVFPSKTNNGTGVNSMVFMRLALIHENEMVSINFLNYDHAHDFYKFAKKFNGNCIKVHYLMRNNGFEVHFGKNSLIVSSFSLEKRVTINSKFHDLSWFFTVYQTLKTEFPQDLIFLITKLIIEIDLPKRYKELNEEFSLARQSVDVKPFKKTICKISCDYDSCGVSDPYIYLSCVNRNDANILFEQLQFYTSLDIELKGNEIAVNPRNQVNVGALGYVPYGAVFNRDENYVYLPFKNEYEADSFLQLIEPDNLLIKPELCQDKVEFEVNTLPIYQPQNDFQPEPRQVFSFGGGI